MATWEQSKASLVLAQQEFDRAKRLLASKVVSKEEYDQKQAALAVATAQVTQALENVYQARAALGLPPVPPAGTNLADVPPNLDQTFSGCARPWRSFSRALHNLALCRPRRISRPRRHRRILPARSDLSFPEFSGHSDNNHSKAAHAVLKVAPSAAAIARLPCAGSRACSSAPAAVDLARRRQKRSESRQSKA